MQELEGGEHPTYPHSSPRTCPFPAVLGYFWDRFRNIPVGLSGARSRAAGAVAGWRRWGRNSSGGEAAVRGKGAKAATCSPLKKRCCCRAAPLMGAGGAPGAGFWGGREIGRDLGTSPCCTSPAPGSSESHVEGGTQAPSTGTGPLPRVPFPSACAGG